MTFVNYRGKAERVALSKQWIAGFFDGEGCIGIYARNSNKKKTQKYYVLVVCIAQSANIGREVLQEIQAIYGGSIGEKKSTSAKKQMWQLYMSADIAYKFLADIHQYLILKKAQSSVAQKFQVTPIKLLGNPVADELALIVKDLKYGI